MLHTDLRTRLYALIGALIAMLVAGGAVTIWHSYRARSAMSDFAGFGMESFLLGYELEKSLLNQKGVVSYFLLSGDTEWLDNLDAHRNEFEQRLKTAREKADTESLAILSKIAVLYGEYDAERQRIIAMYQEGRIEEGAALHRDARNKFEDIRSLCIEYSEAANEKTTRMWNERAREAGRLAGLSAAGALFSILICIVLAFVIITRVLDPIRRIAEKVPPERLKEDSQDEVAALDYGVDKLLDRIGHASVELERSRELLQLSEKMAVVGKLAAEVAHSIRNPMTSIKMRLFSLACGANLDDARQEDLEVIAEEMRRLDNIVINFLEFSRPPQLRKQKIALSDVVDTTLILLEKRFEHDRIMIRVNRKDPLPQIEADPELLKEMLVNLMVNACEAMPEGGHILIVEEMADDEGLGRVARVAVSDDGPGIPERLLESISEPFFTTKETGTGLGLSIATRIINEHGGRLDVLSVEGEGAAFIVSIPIKEDIS
ncbi:MAG TPA: ATP-binding protein [bacterium]|nr:ATP-binding protein [bacterium]